MIKIFMEVLPYQPLVILRVLPVILWVLPVILNRYLKVILIETILHGCFLNGNCMENSNFLWSTTSDYGDRK